MTKATELSDLKVGNKVICVTSYRNRVIRIIETVERTTKTKIITNRGEYRIKDGSSFGNSGGYSMSSTWIQLATPELVEEVHRENRKKAIVRSLEKYDFSKLKLEKLEHVVGIIND